jgi:hypothetical protein
MLDTCLRLHFEPAIAQPEEMIESVENHLVVGDHNDCGVLLGGNPAQQIHDDASARGIERGRGLVGALSQMNSRFAVPRC